MNLQDGFNVPITAILCDGISFRFFEFLRRSPTRNAKPQLFLGQFVEGSEEEPIYEMAPGTDPTDFIRRSRRLCESLYYVFLKGYHTGLEGYWNRSVEKGRSDGKGIDSTPGWVKAKNLARAALEKAQIAWNLGKGGKIDESKVSAEHALELLARRYVPPMFSPTKQALVVANSHLMSQRRRSSPDGQTEGMFKVLHRCYCK